MPPPPSVQSQYLLVLDGQAASLRSVDGGAIKGEVVIVNPGSEKFAQKQIAGVRFEPFAVEMGLSMGKSLAQWIAGSLDLSRTRRSGSVVTTNYRSQGAGIPPFPRRADHGGHGPEDGRKQQGGGILHDQVRPGRDHLREGRRRGRPGRRNTKQKAWLCSNFRFASATCRARAWPASMGSRSSRAPAGTGIEFPNLKIRFSAADAAEWQDWFNEFVVQGRNGQDRELEGAIEFLDPTLKEVLGSIELSQIGIFSLAPEKQEAGSEKIALYIAELYVEQMTLNIKAV